jgi:hypothetical protein
VSAVLIKMFTFSNRRIKILPHSEIEDSVRFASFYLMTATHVLVLAIVGFVFKRVFIKACNN